MIQKTINDLTDDEDVRQDLWISYLSNKPLKPEFFLAQNIIQQLSLKNSFLIRNQFSEEFISHFTNSELLIMHLLIIKCDIGIIEEYTGISKIRINQMIYSIKQSKAWDLLR